MGQPKEWPSLGQWWSRFNIVLFLELLYSSMQFCLHHRVRGIGMIFLFDTIQYRLCQSKFTKHYINKGDLTLHSADIDQVGHCQTI